MRTLHGGAKPNYWGAYWCRVESETKKASRGDGEGVSPLRLTRGPGESCNLPRGVRGRAPAETEFGKI